MWAMYLSLLPPASLMCIKTLLKKVLHLHSSSTESMWLTKGKKNSCQMFHHSYYTFTTACFKLKFTMYSYLSAQLTAGFVLSKILHSFNLQNAPHKRWWVESWKKLKTRWIFSPTSSDILVCSGVAQNPFLLVHSYLHKSIHQSNLL